MGFTEMEGRDRSGGTVTLFRFQTGPDTFYRYADATESVTISTGETFLPATIASDQIENGPITDNRDLNITMPRSTEVASVFSGFPPSFVITCDVLQVHPEDPEKQARRIWSGRVAGCSTEGEQATLVCDPHGSTLQRPGLRRTYGYRCPHVLYGPQCRAVKTTVTLEVAFHAQIANGFVLRPAALLGEVPAHYLGGAVEWGLPDGGREVRTIIGVEVVDEDARVTIAGPVASATPGSFVQLAKGCEHNEESCTQRFNNILNYGGQPWIPTANPIGKISTYY